jgi:hypothetical protein
MTISNGSPRVAGRQYLHTTPELRAKRQEAVKRFVQKDYVETDERLKQTMTAIGVGSAATLAAGVIAAARPDGVPTAGPTTGPIPSPGPSIVAVRIAADDVVGQTADAQIQRTYHRQDGKKADTMSEATPAFRFRSGLGRSTEDQLRTPVRVDTTARAGNHDREGVEVEGRGAGRFAFGRFYQAPSIPPLKNFVPVSGE